MDISKVRRFWTEMVFDETNKLMGSTSFMATHNGYACSHRGESMGSIFYLSYIKISVICLEEFEV